MTSPESGTAIGVALLGAIPIADYRNAISSELDGLPSGAVDPAREVLAIGVAVAPSLDIEGTTLVRPAQQSFRDDWRIAMRVGVAVCLLMSGSVLAAGRAPSQPGAAPTTRTPSH